ncbi:MAG: MATE family efflux transporter [Clostridia bacterium]|nr:MATE family efflux transporter [Clostridia bacterium]
MTASINKVEMDLTTGSIFKKLIIYAIPFMITNILQTLFNTMDIAVLGIFCGDEAVGAVGANAAFTALVVTLFVSFSTGANAVLAKYVGAKDKESARRTVGTSILLSPILGVILILIGVPLVPTFLRLVDCTPELIPMATTYCRIYFLGMPVTLLYNFCASILRAVGDTKRPLIFLTIGGVLNVLLNVFFVAVFKMTVEGVALATIISQAVSAILCLMVMIKGNGYGVLEVKYLKIYKKQLKEITQIGVPTGLQSIILSISNVFIQSAINSFGVPGTSGNTAATQFDSIISQVGLAIAMSSMAFVSQNVGAKDAERVKKSIIYGVCLTAMICSGLALTLVVFSHFFCGLIAHEKEVIEFAVMRIWVIAPSYVIFYVGEVLAYSLRGMGRPVISLVINIISSFVLRTACLEILMSVWRSFPAIFLSYSITWLINLAVFTCIIPSVYKKVKREIQSEQCSI